MDNPSRLTHVLLAVPLLTGCLAEADLPPEDTTTACELLDKVEIIDGRIVLEGDMVLGDESELDSLCDPGDPDAPVPQGIGIDGHRWPGGVVRYGIDPGLPDAWRVTDAIAHWEANTPIRFVADASGDHVWFTNGSGCSADVGREGGRQHVWLSTGKSRASIVGTAIAKNDWVYAWYADGMASAGTTSDLDDRRVQYPYTLPSGYTTGDIVGVAIAKSNDRVYTWYDNYRMTVGSSDDLDRHKGPTVYSLPPGYTPANIVNVAINKTDRVYTWYTDGRLSIGTSTDLDYYAAPHAFTPASGRTVADILSVAIAGSNDYVYAWYDDGFVSAGTSTDLDARKAPYEFTTPAGCGTGSVIHEIGHTLGLRHEQTRCDRDSHVRVFWDNIQSGKSHNFDRLCSGNTDYGAYDFSSVMHYPSWGFSSNGSPTLLRLAGKGLATSGVAGVAIAKNDWVYTWWTDGTVTAGHSNDLESRRSRYDYTLPDGYAPSDIAGIAIAKSTDRVYAFYRNGRVSVGTTDDLDKYAAPYLHSLPPGYSTSSIVGIAIAKDDKVYAWYSNGRATSGTSSDLDKYRAPYVYTLPSGYSVYDVLGIGIAGSNDYVYAWYDNGRVSTGHTDDLDDRALPYSFRGRGLTVGGSGTLSAGDIATINAMY